MEYVDLSLPLENDRRWAPWWARTRVRCQSHRFGAWAIRLVFRLPTRLLPGHLGWANETIALSTHGTTHVDAPWHYAPRCGTSRARTIDELPLSWFHGPGVVLDISHVAANTAAEVDDLQRALLATGHDLQAGDIVLVRTGNDRLWGQRAYFHTGPGVSAHATHWLIDQGIRLMGIDAWGWDMPLRLQARRARREMRRDVFWAAHFVGRHREYSHMERLANLDLLPSSGFTVCAFPLKVKGGSAGPARVVAILDRGSGHSARGKR